MIPSPLALRPQPSDPSRARPAAAFAEAAGLDGLVTACTPLLAPPAAEGRRLCALLSRGGARPLCSYGRRNNDPAAAAAQLALGVDAVIVDHVAYVAGALAGQAGRLPL